MMTKRENKMCGRADRSAFTLLELLVVIAIIALLVAILLPSLEAARRASKNSACLANIKNIGTSSRVYEADDPNGWGIPVHPLQFRQDPDNPTYIGAYEWGGKSGLGRLGWSEGVKDQTSAHAEQRLSTSKYGTAAGFGPASRPMNIILYPAGFEDNTPSVRNPRPYQGQIRDTQLDLPIFRCPGDDGAPQGTETGTANGIDSGHPHCESWCRWNPDMPSYDFFGNSYSANLFMIGSSGGGCFLSNSPYMRPTSRVPTPARTLYYEENIGRWAWAARLDWCGKSNLDGLLGVNPGPTKALRGWHGRDWTYNRTFVDSHAETQKIYIDGTEDTDGYAHHYVNEKLSSYPGFLSNCQYESTDTLTQEQREDQYTCIIIRGLGWAKDTLPSPFVQTKIVFNPALGRPSYEDCVESDR
ncbi:MAG: type II secretion system protein [Planctomycetota bacterium]